MKLIRPYIEFLNMTRYPLETIERAGRTCYKSEDKITQGSMVAFVQKILKNGHLAMIEHAWASYKVITDRGVTHEVVRHRLFSYAQESTRYCNYKGGMTFVLPPWIDVPIDVLYEDIKDISCVCNVCSSTAKWLTHLLQCNTAYVDLIENCHWTPQQARSVLPNALKTEIVITGNFRQWLHFLTLRTAKTAHPQMQEVANMLLIDIRNHVSVIFDNL